MRLNISKKFLTLVLSVGASLILIACSGNEPLASGPTTLGFTSFGAIKPSTTTVISGDSAQGTYSWDKSTDKITAVTSGAQQSGAAFTLTRDSNNLPKSVNFTTASGTNLTFTSPTDTLSVLSANPNVAVAVSQDGTKYALAGGGGVGWDYQTFGVWVTGAGTGSGTYGAASFGAATAAGSIPTSDSATYIGSTGGRSVAADGTYFFTTSDLTSNVNFAARTVSFATANTVQSKDLISFVPNSALNLTGALAYSAGSNQFTGAVTNGSTLTGTATGRFYGPAAQEIGGTFGVTGAGITAYGGGFGAKK